MDVDLVVQAQKGDRAAFESLTIASHPRLYRAALGILRDQHLAEDATQQALIEIWRYLRRLRDPAKYEAWSYRLLVRACVAEGKGRSQLASGLAAPKGRLALIEGLRRAHSFSTWDRCPIDLAPGAIRADLAFPRPLAVSHRTRIVRPAPVCSTS
jgi:DNA-directed RNA polymerase specialized sigma24 family protein